MALGTEATDAVCHQASRVGLGVRFSDVADYVSDNDQGTASMLLAMDQVGFTGRLVLASSMVVYGEGAYACRSCGSVRPAARTAARLAIGAFEPLAQRAGETSRSSSQWKTRRLTRATCTPPPKSIRSTCALPTGGRRARSVIALRYHNVYGPRSPIDTPYSGRGQHLCQLPPRRYRPRVFEDGGQRRDFVHVSDVARANVLALTAPPEVQGSFNIASGTSHTILDLATKLWEVLGASAPAPEVRRPVEVGRRPSHPGLLRTG